MSEISFDSDLDTPTKTINRAVTQSGLTGLVMRMSNGHIKSTKTANLILFLLASVLIMLSLYQLIGLYTADSESKEINILPAT